MLIQYTSIIIILYNFVLPLPGLQQESFQIGETEKKKNLLLVINQAETNLSAFSHPGDRELNRDEKYQSWGTKAVDMQRDIVATLLTITML